MKLKLDQLKQIIREEVVRARSLREAVEDQGDLDSALGAFIDAWSSAQEYREDDPSMNALGPETWDSQVFAASQDLEQRVRRAMQEVQDLLDEGSFYDERSGGPPDNLR